MGLLPSNIALLAREQRRGVIRGSALTLGQPAVWTTLADVLGILQSQGLSPSPLPPDFDCRSKVNPTHPLWKARTNAQTVLGLLGASSTSVADCSTYESPDLLIDLNTPIAREHFDRFDTILDCGTLEHVFNLPVALSNVKNMLKKGGHLVLINPASGQIDHSFYSINPTLYFDYFKANGFTDLRCYLCQTCDESRLASGFPPRTTTIFDYSSGGPQFSLDCQVEMVFVAKKSDEADPTSSTIPMQNALVSDPAWSEGLPQQSQRAAGARERGLYGFIKSLIPLRWKISALLTLSLVRGRKRPPATLKRLGQVTCCSNPLTFDTRTSVNLERSSRREAP